MQGLYTILLLVASNVFMTFAWYGHLKLTDYKFFSNLPLIGLILCSWGVAFFEYCCMIPANRIGFHGNGGPFSLMQLKIIQEAITLVVFILFTTFVFKSESFRWNHVMAVLCIMMAVYFVFKK